MNHYTAEELRAAIKQRNTHSYMPDGVRLRSFVQWWWIEHLSEDARDEVRAKGPRSEWAGHWLADLPDEELMFLWAAYLL